MRPCHTTITRDDVHRHVLHRLTTHLRLPDLSCRTPAAVVLQVVLAAAARLCSLFAAARRLATAPSDQTIRTALVNGLPERWELERRLNRALTADLPRSLAGTRQPLALDLTLRPYHGQPFRDVAEVYRSQAKSGTSHVHAYATVYLVRHGRRFTLALTWVTKGESLAGVIQRLLRTVRANDIRPRYLLLDRGFGSVDVVRFLQAGRHPFRMPLPLRGRPLDHPGGPSGRRVFAAARRSGWGEDTMTNVAGRRATVGVCVKCRNWRGERGRRGRQRLVYAFWGITPARVDWVRRTYRTRFGIESSYRPMNQAKAATTIRNPVVRLFLVGVALVLRNVRVWLHWEQRSMPHRGGRVVRLDRLPFKSLLLWLLHVVEERFGCCDSTRAERPPLHPLAK